MTQEKAEVQQNDDVVVTVVLAVAQALLALVLLPLVLPMFAWGTSMGLFAAKEAFWRRERWHTRVSLAGVVLFAVVAWIEVAQITQWVQAGGVDEVKASAEPFALVWSLVWPWLVVNFAAGALLVPATVLMKRRRIARLTALRRIPDVQFQFRVDRARARAADAQTARMTGVRLDTTTGEIRGVESSAPLAPLMLSGQGVAFGLRVQPTVKNVAERVADRREVPDWCQGRHVVLPEKCSAVRALLLAESGVGKTTLLDGMMLAASVQRHWPMVFIDGKGNPADAEELAEVLRAQGRTVRVRPKWNLFSGGSSHITDKIMRLTPASSGDGQFYRDEQEAALIAIQAKKPLRSIDDLQERLTKPQEWVASQRDLKSLTREATKGVSVADRVLTGLLMALNRLAPYISEDGWSYDNLGADVVIMPLRPVDKAERRIGDLLLMDLLVFLTHRMEARDSSPYLVVIDEFAQFVAEGEDPAEVAARVYETARSIGVGVILAAQGVAGIATDERRAERMMTSGVALLVGRSKGPEAVSSFAGTTMQLESTADGASGQLGSGRAQHTYLLPPQSIREATAGFYWLIQGGGLLAFRSLAHAGLLPPTQQDNADGRQGERSEARQPQPERSGGRSKGTTATVALEEGKTADA